MDENRIEGTARNRRRKGSRGLRQGHRQYANRRPKAWQIKRPGPLKTFMGKRQTPRVSGERFEKALRHSIETQPYTSAFVALGIGWLLGRMHRPF